MNDKYLRRFLEKKPMTRAKALYELAVQLSMQSVVASTFLHAIWDFNALWDIDKTDFSLSIRFILNFFKDL